MLRLCLTLSVLLGQQVSGMEVIDPRAEACKSMTCFDITSVIPYNGYEEDDLPSMKWIYIFINGTDIRTATDTALDRFFKYSRFNNVADTIVPISAPLVMRVPFENGKIKPAFTFFVSIPVDVQTPPEPRDPSVQIVLVPPGPVYVRTFEQKTEDYGHLANEFKKDLENDGHLFDSSHVYIVWFNTRGHFQILFA